MYNIEIKILCKLRYRTILSRSTILTILTILSTVYRRFSFLGTILAASVDVRELFLAAHFSRKFEKPSDKVPTVHFFLCKQYHTTFRNLPSKIVLYSIYVIMYIRRNQLTQTTDHRLQTDGHTLNLSYYLTSP